MAIPQNSTLKTIRAGIKRGKALYKTLSFNTRKDMRRLYRRYVLACDAACVIPNKFPVWFYDEYEC